MEDVGHWLAEKTAVSANPVVVKDLHVLSIQLEKQKIFETENKKWRKKYDGIQKSAKTLSLNEDANFESKIRQIDRQVWTLTQSFFREFLVNWSMDCLMC